MKLEIARQQVIQAGRQLVSSGLIARTWGNVSCRVSKDLFVITPSGRNYLALREEEIVPVHLADLSHEGNIEPSSEKRIHGAAYLMNPDTNFIIHTHQENASVVSALGLSAVPVPPDYRETLGTGIPCANYALPGTKALCRHTAAALSRTKGNAVIMKRHGALCIGRTCEEAFDAAFKLEEVCGMWLAKLFNETRSKKPTSVTPCGFHSSRRGKKGFFLETDGEEIEIPFGAAVAGLERECALCTEIYKEHPHIHFIESTVDSAVLFALEKGVLKTWLDDFAQIVGRQLTVLPPEPSAVSRSLKRVSAVLARNMGGLCFGKTESDAAAVRLLLEKNCKAFQTAYLYGKSADFSSSRKGAPSPVHPLEAAVMRQVYLKKYSRRF